MKRSIIIAVVLALATIGWIASGQFDGARQKAEADGAPEISPGRSTPSIQSVRVRRLASRQRVRRIIVNGRTEASRVVKLRAEIEGRVVALGARTGSGVRRGALIVRLSTDDRKARLAEAKALLRQRDMEYQAARKLFKKGFRSDTKVAEARANFDSARAGEARRRLDLERTKINAPFDGLLDRRMVERGAFVRVGDVIATIVDLNPILVVGYVSERDIGAVSIGTKGTARLSSGATVHGTVQYIASVADPATRTFRVELKIANSGGGIRDGLTSELRLPMPAVAAHRITPALLTLDPAGRIGVKLLGGDNRVVFLPVEIIQDSKSGVWVTGLPERVVVISVGHEYVQPGDQVNPIFEADGVSG